MRPRAEDESGQSAARRGTGEAALTWAVGEGRGADLEQRIAAAVRRGRARRRRVVVGVACCAGLLAVAGLSLRHERPEAVVAAAPKTGAAIVTLPAKRVLGDGSVVELNAQAEIDVQFEVTARRVVLRRGEAHFDVRKEAGRPFVVVAHGVEVRAVGTAFAVQVGATDIEVVVTEGTVAVAQRKEAAAVEPSARDVPLTMVQAGNRIVIEVATSAGAAPVLPVTATELSDRLAWRVPRLEFSGTPLAEVIPLFNQHSPVTLILGPGLGGLQMSGVLRANNVEALLRLLKSEFGIEAERRGEREIFLRR